MDRIIYTSMTGANAAAHRQAVLSNNLANASTQGFRAEMSTFRSVPIQGEGSTTRVFALEATSGHVNTPGPVQRTGRNLDAMAIGNAWFAVHGLDGTEAYTRAGALDLDAQGQIVTRTGLPVLGEGGPITVPAGGTLAIGSDGTVSVTGADGRTTTAGRLKMVTPQEPLTRGTDGLFRGADGAALPTDPAARLRDGTLEGSNVSPVETMVAMIAAARQFEQQMKLMQTAERQSQTAAKLLGG